MWKGENWPCYGGTVETPTNCQCSPLLVTYRDTSIRPTGENQAAQEFQRICMDTVHSLGTCSVILATASKVHH